MKLFLLGWWKEVGMTEAAFLLSKEHKVVYWTMPNLASFDQSRFPQTIFHDHNDAVEGKLPRAATWEDFPPPSEEFLASLYETESVVVNMMSKHFETMGLSERKHLYYHYVWYWHGVLLKLKPDAVIFPNVPHGNYDFVVYKLAKRLGVKTVMMDPTWVGDRMVIFTDYETREGALSIATLESMQTPASPENLPQDIREEFLRQTGGGDATPVFQRSTVKRYSGLRKWQLKGRALRSSLIDGSFPQKAMGFAKKLALGNLKREYERVVSPPDFAAPFVYVPLHYQPERTTCPQGGIFVDQILMLETLAFSLPKGWRIYVKEHPTQWFYRGLTYFSYRYKGYYERIAKIPNVSLIPLTENPYRLMEKAAAVATLTGTSGFEAVCRQKPVFVFGYAWYQDFPGIFRIRGTKSCTEAFQKLVSGEQASDEEDVFRYLRALDKGTFHAYLDRNGEKVSKLTPHEENSRAIVAALDTLLCSQL